VGDPFGLAWGLPPSNISIKYNGEKTMGRYGLHSGYGKFQNIQSGKATVTLDSNGDGTKAVTFKRKFKNIPAITVSAATQDDTITVNYGNPTVSGFTIHCDGATVTGTDITVSYIAMDDPATGFA